MCFNIEYYYNKEKQNAKLQVFVIFMRLLNLEHFNNISVIFQNILDFILPNCHYIVKMIPLFELSNFLIKMANKRILRLHDQIYFQECSFSLN